MEDMTQLTKKFPAADPSVYVDDSTCDTAQDTFEEVLDVLVPYSLEFARRMAKKKLTLSAKGSICCNSVARAKILAVELAQYSLIYQVDSQVRDLGITYSAGTARPKNMLLKRFAKVKKRILKIKSIAKISKMAKKLYTGSAFAASTWGHQCCGVTPAENLTLKREALACSGIPAAGRCRLTSLIIIHGMHGNPHARIVRESVKAWFYILGKKVIPSEHLDTAWARTRRLLASSRHPHQLVSSIMSDMINILYSA